jgi:hypothetical protein
MPMTIDPPAPGPWWKRLAWFVALWTAGVAVVGTVAYFIRWWLV